MDFVVTDIDREAKTVTLSGRAPGLPGDFLALKALSLGMVEKGTEGTVLRCGPSVDIEVTRETWPLLFGDAPIPVDLK